MKINKMGLAVIFAILSVLTAKVDSIFYLYYLHLKGENTYWFVNFDTLLGYYKTLPGFISTLFFLLSITGFLIVMHIASNSKDSE